MGQRSETVLLFFLASNVCKQHYIRLDWSADRRDAVAYSEPPIQGSLVLDLKRLTAIFLLVLNSWEALSESSSLLQLLIT